MAVYNLYPAVDSEFQFPPPVRQALSSSVEFQTGISTQVASMVPGQVATALATDSTIAAAAVVAMGDAAIKAKLAWVQPNLASGTDLNSLTKPGVHPVATYAVSQSLINGPDAPNQGAVEVVPLGSTIKQTYHYGNGYNNPKEAIRTMSGASWGPWVMTSLGGATLRTGDDLNDLINPGVYGVTLSSVASSLKNTPPGVGLGYCEVRKVSHNLTSYKVTQFWISQNSKPQVWYRTLSEGGPVTDWSEIGSSENDSSPSFSREVRVQQSKIRHGGTIGVGNKATIGLSFDHGFSNFRDYVLPDLIRLGLPASVAVNSNTLGSGESEGVNLSTLQGWAIQHGIEIANHSRSHSDSTTDSGIVDAILGSKALIESEMPEIESDLYIMPGVSGTRYRGFDSGSPISNWYTHIAGQTILDNHAIVTAGRDGQIMPGGDCPVGMDRVGFDTVSWANVLRTRIVEAERNNGHMQIFMHPSYINNGITSATVTSFLEFLAEERNAGRLEVLTVSGAAWATPDHERRFNIANPDLWLAGTQTVNLSPLYDWALGGTFELQVDSSVDVSISLVSDLGGLNVTQVCKANSGKARLYFTIPKSATTLTITTPSVVKIMPA